MVKQSILAPYSSGGWWLQTTDTGQGGRLAFLEWLVSGNVGRQVWLDTVAAVVYLTANGSGVYIPKWCDGIK